MQIEGLNKIKEQEEEKVVVVGEAPSRRPTLADMIQATLEKTEGLEVALAALTYKLTELAAVTGRLYGHVQTLLEQGTAAAKAHSEAAASLGEAREALDEVEEHLANVNLAGRGYGVEQY